MSRRSDESYLGDMLDYARQAHGKVAGLTVEQWQADDNLRLAVAYLVQIVGEAASRPSDSTRASLPDLPWQQMIAVRHRLVHGYAAIRLNAIWDIATQDLPPLIATLEKIVPPNQEP